MDPTDLLIWADWAEEYLGQAADAIRALAHRPRPFLSGSGYGSGYRSGYGDGHGCGYGYGDGHGSGYGDSYGDGYGDGSGDGRSS